VSPVAVAAKEQVMTRQNTFKRKVRARIRRTGESYTAARRQLIAAGERPSGRSAGFKPPVSEEAVRKATGRAWQEWFVLLDQAGAIELPHREIARRLRDENGVDGWWAQSVTVAYEQARGLRAPGQRPDGWEVTASKTVKVPIERLYEAFTNEAWRERWLPGAELGLRTATAPKSARYDWEDGSTRVVVGFEAKGDGKSVIALAHQKLPDADTAEAMKAYWRERVALLKELLERDDG
jgi:uncharacterized protein YndB with AHSA1/START domain